MSQFTSFEKTLENIGQQLQQLMQMQEFSDLQESGFYHPDVTLGDALQAVTEALGNYLEMQTTQAESTASPLCVFPKIIIQHRDEFMQE